MIRDFLLMQNKKPATFWNLRFLKLYWFVYGKDMKPCKLLINRLSLKEAQVLSFRVINAYVNFVLLYFFYKFIANNR